MNFGKVVISSACVVLLCGAASSGFAGQPPSVVATSATAPASGASAATTSTPTAPTGADATPATTAEDNRKVCRQRETLGSRLRATRVCRTQAEWRAADNAGRESGKRITTQPTAGANEARMGGG
jgi:hypothetical protein